MSLLSDDVDDEMNRTQFENEVLNHALDQYARGRVEDAARVIIDFLEGSSGVYDSLPKETKEVIAANSCSTFEDMKEGFGEIEPSELNSLKTPTLIMKSELGQRILKRVVDLLYERLPNRLLKEVKGTSHGTIIESTEYADSVLDFISRN